MTSENSELEFTKADFKRFIDNVQREADAPDWEYPAQVVRDVGLLRMYRDKLRAELAALTAELAEARRDSQRLDWLERQTSNPGAHPSSWRDASICGPGNHGGKPTNWLLTIEGDSDARPFQEAEGNSLRAAIDAAIAVTEKKPE